MSLKRRQSHRRLVTILLLILGLDSVVYAADSFITRRPEQGQYYRRAGPNDITPVAPDCSAYVPAYSHIYLFESGRIPLAITLSIRNTDMDTPLYLEKISYFAADGKLIETVLADTWILAPMATATYAIDQHDMRGGGGANFVVQWASDKTSSSPLIETVMAGYRGSKGLGFISRGISPDDC